MSKGTLRFRHFHDQDVAEVFYKFHGKERFESAAYATRQVPTPPTASAPTFKTTPPITEAVTRLAWYGRQYTHLEFLEQYGIEKGPQYWKDAAPRQVEHLPTIPSTGDHYTDLKRRLKAKSNKIRPQEPSKLKEWHVQDELLKVQERLARLNSDELMDCRRRLEQARKESAMVVRRLAWDGRQYTRCQFLGYYGVREGTQYWEAAAAPAQVAVASQARQASKPLWQNPDALSYKDTLLVKRPNAAPPTNDGTGIQLYIKTHTSETITIFVEKKSTIRAVKELIWTEVGILPHEQRLTFQGSGEKWMECTTDLSTLRSRYSREHDDLEVLFKLTSKGRFEDVAYAARKATEKKVIMSSPEDDFQALALKAGITTNLALTTITSRNGENHSIEEFGNRFPSPSEVPIEMFPLVFVFTEPDQDIAPPQVALKTEGQPAPQETENKTLEEDDDKALLIPLHSKEQPPPQKVGKVHDPRSEGIDLD